MYEGVARNKQQIDATSGAMVGEATRQGNVTQNEQLVWTCTSMYEFVREYIPYPNL